MRGGMKIAGLVALAASLAGCANLRAVPGAEFQLEPTLAQVTASQLRLRSLPPPPSPIAVAVYNYTDQTGQLKPSENFQSLSRAVTQGATSVLVKALQDAGSGRWFTVVERERLDNLLKERQIIREMRQRYLGEQETPAGVLPALLFAGILLEGGIIGYDTNTLTGGAGARFLGIGGSTQYRQNTVTVYLRAVSVKTGEVLSSVTTQKTIASFALEAGAFKFVKFDELLEAEAGVTSNEPTQIALQEAIEKAVYTIVLQGTEQRLWSFADRAAAQAYLDHYARERQRADRDIHLGKDDPSYPENRPGAQPAASTNSAPAAGARTSDVSQELRSLPRTRRPAHAARAPHNPQTVTGLQ